MRIDGKVASFDGVIEHSLPFAGQAFRNYYLLDAYMCSGVQIIRLSSSTPDSHMQIACMKQPQLSYSGM